VALLAPALAGAPAPAQLADEDALETFTVVDVDPVGNEIRVRETDGTRLRTLVLDAGSRISPDAAGRGLTLRDLAPGDVIHAPDVSDRVSDRVRVDGISVLSAPRGGVDRTRGRLPQGVEEGPSTPSGGATRDADPPVVPRDSVTPRAPSALPPGSGPGALAPSPPDATQPPLDAPGAVERTDPSARGAPGLPPQPDPASPTGPGGAAGTDAGSGDAGAGGP
jgi:hypothetical protein